MLRKMYDHTANAYINLPEYCLDTTKGQPGMEDDGTIYKLTKSNITLNSSNREISSSTWSVKQIRMFKYTVAANITVANGNIDISLKNEPITKESWVYEKQVVCWMIAEPDKKEEHFNTFTNTKYAWNTYHESVNKDVVRKLYNKAEQYATAMSKDNYDTMEKIPTISVDENAKIEKYGTDTYKLGPFTLNYLAQSLKYISRIAVTRIGDNIILDSNKYLYSDGTRGEALPKSGEKFYLIIKGFTTGSQGKVKVAIYHRYESCENLTLVTARVPEQQIQPILLVEGTPNVGEGKSEVEIDAPLAEPTKYQIDLNKLDSENNNRLKGATFKVKINGTEHTAIANNNGYFNLIEVDVESEGTDIIEIIETGSPNNYKKLNGTLKLEVTKTLDRNSWSYKATNVKITQNFTDENGNAINAVVMTYNNNTNTIKLDIKNEREKIKLSGYVWEDIPVGKETEIDGKKNNNDKFISGIQVTLHTSNGQNILYTNSSTLQTNTDTNGYYEFEVPKGYSYYIEFKYNGQNYQHTKYTTWTKISSNNGKTSNATERESTRNELNAKFETIYPNMFVAGKNNTEKWTKIDNTINEKDATYIGSSCYRISAYTGSHKVLGNGEQAEDYIKYYSETSENINLGLTKRETADLAIRKDVYQATLSINDYSQDYIYNKRNGLETDANGNSYWDIRARQSDTYYGTNYEREIRSSDYNYNGENRLSAEVVYKITIRNQSGLLNTKLTELVDYYDADYTYKEAYIQNGNNKTSLIASATSKYTHNTTIANYQKMYFDMSDITIKPGEDLELYVVFTVKVDSSGKLIVDDQNGDIGKGNLIEIMGYKAYYGENVKSPNDGNSSTYTEYKSGDVAGRIDVDSNPGNTSSIDSSTFEDDTDRAPYVKFTVTNNNPRTVKGVVWEDKRTVEGAEQGNAVVGDGIRQDGESLVESVIVELWNADANNIAQVWNGTQWVDARTESNKDNGYSIANFIPGNYYVMFKYKDGQNYKSTTYNYEKVEEGFNIEHPDILGTYKETTDVNYSDARDLWGDKDIPGTREYVNNNVLQETTESDKLTIVIQPEDQYIKYGDKATFTIEAIGGTNIRYQWHTIEGNVDKIIDGATEKTYTTESMSDDQDFLTYFYCIATNDKGESVTSNTVQAKRTIIGSNSEKTRKTQSVSSTAENEMHAVTGKIHVNFEADTNDTNSNSGRKYDLENIDFGLQERPKAQLTISKEITNAKVVLANGSVLFDASGRATNVMWQDKKTHGYRYSGKLMTQPIVNRGSQQVLLTMDEELMHGANINITYKISVKNIGEVDYPSMKFYYTGKKTSDDTVVTTTVCDIVDYAGASGSSDPKSVYNNLKFNANENSGWTLTTAAELKNDRLVQIKNSSGNDITSNIQKYNTILKYNFNKELKPDIESPEESAVATTLTLSQVITPESNSDDQKYSNMVEILTFKNGVGRKMAYSTVGNQDPDDKIAEVDADLSQLTILPPFGQRYVYYILGIGISIIIIAGIIIIKKKVLKK